MDQSSRDAAQPPPRREMMFCHECNDEWYRDEKGIICPECQSEFTEIIEEDNDPRDNFAHGHDNDDDGDSLPSLEDAPPSTNPFANHNPWANVDDPDEGDISQMRFQPVGPGRFHVQATIHRTVSPASFGAAGAGLNTMSAFQSFLTNLMQGAVGPQAQAQAQGQDRDRSQSQSADGQSESRQAAPGEPQVHRFSYTSSARLFPRDADHPGPRLEPVDDLNNVMAGLLAMIGEPPGGARSGPGQAHMPPNPLMGLFAAISGGQHGDAVYSQEALDRIISQLMEQNNTSNAPGPASQQDIEALPRKQVTEEMLGAEHRAECSICMDEVNIGEEVTELPCKHWFHHACVAAWLGEHDTCPHCRKSIKSEGNSNSGTASGTANANANDRSSGGDPTSSMPGSFDVAGQRTADDPCVAPGESPHANRASNSNATNATVGSSNEQGPGLGERIRRGLFGAQD